MGKRVNPKVKEVRLTTYMHEVNVTTIDTFIAKDWGDFVIITLAVEQAVTQEQYQNITDAFRQHSDRMDKQIILIPKGLDFEFYGVEVYDDKDD